MNRLMIVSVAALMFLSSCDTSAGSGAYLGANLGSILGSAIGGINGGPRGSDMGTLIGMAGGAIAGAAIGSAADNARQKEYADQMRQREAPYTRYGQKNRAKANGAAVPRKTYGTQDDSGFDPTNSGDDRIVMEDGQNQGTASGNRHVYTTVKPTTVSPQTLRAEQLEKMMPGFAFNYNDKLEVRNVSFVDYSGDGILKAGEQGQVSFEIMNNSSAAMYDILPTVLETTGNKNIRISPSIRVESILPGKGVRYSASLLAGRKLKDGSITLRIAVAQGNNDITSKVTEFVVPTQRK